MRHNWSTKCWALSARASQRAFQSTSPRGVLSPWIFLIFEDVKLGNYVSLGDGTSADFHQIALSDGLVDVVDVTMLKGIDHIFDDHFVS